METEPSVARGGVAVAIVAAVAVVSAITGLAARLRFRSWRAKARLSLPVTARDRLSRRLGIMRLNEGGSGLVLSVCVCCLRAGGGDPPQLLPPLRFT